MKRYAWFVAIIAALAVVMTACSSKKDEVDTAKLQKAFQNADPTVNSTINKVVVDIQSADYTSALTELKKVGEAVKLTPEQQKAVKDTIEQLTKAIGDKAKSAVGDVQKALPK